MKKTLIAALAAASLLGGGVALAADPSVDATAQLTNTAVTSVSADQAGMVRDWSGQPGQFRGGQRPMIRGGMPGFAPNGGRPMMGQRGPSEGFSKFAIVPIFFATITMLLGWAIMVLVIIALLKWIKKQNK